MAAVPLDFTSSSHLQAHIDGVLAFYSPHCQASVGFHHFYNDDGSVASEQTLRHLVSETRFVWQFSLAFLRSGKSEYKVLAKHGLKSLLTKFKDPVHGHFRWTFEDDHLACGNALLYGHSFGLMAVLAAQQAGIDVGTAVDDIWTLMESKFYEPEHQAYADEMDVDLKALSPYRGQNANMHACEACIFAYKMTGAERYLQRALDLIETFVFRLATDLGVWEHYHEDWSIDWDYNKDDKTNIFKPWGYQTGEFYSRLIEAA
jgi:mannose/cellobiose epimerase-like protein (N-acyl-D-glucosamine 2-epimerase family)